MTKAKIMIVEDESIVAWDISQQLEQMEYAVCAIANSGAAAIAAAKRHRPDLILMDIVIKGDMDGIDTALAIERELHTSVIFLTAHNDSGTVSRAVASSPYGYLTKPFQARELRACIEVALGKAALDRQLRDSERWFAAILRCVGEGVVVTDSAGRIRLMNLAAEALSGLDSVDVEGKPSDEIFTFHDRLSGAKIESPLTRALNGDEGAAIGERAVLTADAGRQLPIDDSAAPIHLEDGSLVGAVLVFRDVTERLAAEEKLRRSEMRFHNAFVFAPIGVALVDLHGTFIEVNGSLCAMLKSSPDELKGALQETFIHVDDRASEFRHRLQLLAGESSVVQFEIRYQLHDQSVAWTLISASLLHQDSQPHCLLYQVHDITARKDAETRLARLAYYDTLTGLPNRALLCNETERLIATEKRRGNKLACLFIDVDQFKNVNDTLGHEVGDMMLKVIADGLRRCVREVDRVGRLGGDEFVVLLPDLADAQDIRSVAEKIWAFCSQPINLQGHELHVGLSIGVSLYPDDGDTREALYRCADSAMYHAKDRGRNNIQYYRPEMTARLESRTRTERDLRSALRLNEFALIYEPIMGVSGQHRVGEEALIRWRHPQLGLLLPDSFIPVAEDSGLIVPIGEWVIDAACRHAFQAENANESLISLNLSPRQMLSPNLVRVVERALLKYEVRPARLCLEITEQCLMLDNEATRQTIAGLKGLGVQIVIDDFGIGYSSLRYLKRLGPGIIKIDRSFIQDVIKDSEDRAVVGAIIAMAHSLNIAVIAEGVEHEDQRAYLSREGCDMVQGYLYPAKPFLSAGASAVTSPH